MTKPIKVLIQDEATKSGVSMMTVSLSENLALAVELDG